MKTLSQNLVTGLAVLTMASTVAFGASLNNKPRPSTAAVVMPGPNPYPPAAVIAMPGPNPYPPASAVAMPGPNPYPPATA